MNKPTLVLLSLAALAACPAAPGADGEAIDPAESRGAVESQLAQLAPPVAAAGHPDAEWVGSPGFAPGQGDRRTIVLHAIGSTADAALARMKDPSAGFSTHYLVTAEGRLLQLVAEAERALHPGDDGRSIVIGLEPAAGDPSRFGDPLYRTASDLVRFLADSHGIPPDRLHVIGAEEAARRVGAAAPGGDPGPGFDWQRLLAPDGGALRANGRIRGFTYYGSNASDTTKRIAGATLRVAQTGATTTSASNGYYEFSLPPASYTVEASATGYQPASVTKTVPDGGEVWGSISLTPAPVDTAAPAVAIESPATGANFDSPQVTVRGSASDDSGAVAEVRFSLNGAGASPRPVAGGRFEFAVTLQPGENVLAVEATDGAGNVGRAQATARFVTGISGFVFEGADPSRPLAGAVVVLLSSAGEATGDAASGPDGAFRLDCAPGSYTLRADADGYAQTEKTVIVGAEGRAQVQLGLYRDGSEPSLAFTIPEPGALVSLSPITVSGTCLGFLPLAIAVNGVEASLGEGTFEATVALVPGANTLTATATRQDAPSLTATIEVTYQPPAQQGPTPEVDSACGCSAGSTPAAPVGLLALLALLARRPRGPRVAGG